MTEARERCRKKGGEDDRECEYWYLVIVFSELFYYSSIRSPPFIIFGNGTLFCLFSLNSI